MTNLGNEFQNLAVGDMVERGGIRYTVTGFMLHLDAIHVRVTRVQDGAEFVTFADGMNRVTKPLPDGKLSKLQQARFNIAAALTYFNVYLPIRTNVTPGEASQDRAHLKRLQRALSLLEDMPDD